MPYVSVLMPVYNAEKYLNQSIHSVIAQTFTDWELIIVDDCSTDTSFSIAKNASETDERIKVYKLHVNSGSAQKPRNYAESLATGEFVTSIDSDDMWESKYLELMIKRQKETNSDAVVCSMCDLDEKGNTGSRFNPVSTFDINQIITGKEAFRLTVGDWKINGQGLLLLLLLARKSHELFSIPDEIINADELLTRQRFLCCKKVAFSDAKYFYRSNSQSITKKFSLKFFGYLVTAKALVELTKKFFGKEDEIYKYATLNYLKYIKYSIKLYAENKYLIDDNLQVLNNIKKHWLCLDFKQIMKSNLKDKLTYILGVNFLLLYFRAKNFIHLSLSAISKIFSQ